MSRPKNGKPFYTQIMTPRIVGVSQVIFSGVCFGFLGLFGKWLYENHVKPGELLALRFLVASCLGLAFLVFQPRRTWRLTARQWAACAALGIGGYALFSFCFFTALTGLSASLTVLLLYTYPVLVALGGWLLYGESIPKQHQLAIPIASLGLVALVWGDLTIDRIEYLGFGLAAALFYAAYILACSHWLKGIEPLTSTPLIQLFAGLTLGSLYLRDGVRILTILEANWFTIFLVAFVCTVMAMGFFLAGLQKLKSWEVSVLSTTEPLTGVLVATLALHESLSVRQMAGGAAILFALIWVSRPLPQQKTGPA